MSNIAGKAYAMNVLTPMKPGQTWKNWLFFMLIRLFPKYMAGLHGLKFIHFARWVIIKRGAWPSWRELAPDTPEEQRPPDYKIENDYMLFCSNFNGTWHQYIDAFSDGIPAGLDLFWYSNTKYPQSIPITPFKNYIKHNQIYTDYYYNATPGSGQRDIKAAQKLLATVRTLAAKHKKMTPEAFEVMFHKAMVDVQNCLAAPGYAPVASIDTTNAETNLLTWVGLEKNLHEGRSDAVKLRVELESGQLSK